MTSELLTMPEAAALARVTERTLNRYIAAGKGPAVTRFGHRVLFRAADFADWLKANTHTQAAA